MIPKLERSRQKAKKITTMRMSVIYMVIHIAIVICFIVAVNLYNVIMLGFAPTNRHLFFQMSMSIVMLIQKLISIFYMNLNLILKTSIFIEAEVSQQY